jgi:translation elongation factor EF-Tu-like GTPase
MKVMTVEHVMRVKGTELIGKLDCDVRIGEKLTVNSHVTVLLAIDKGFVKVVDSALAGEGVALYFRGIGDVDIQPGMVVTKDE